MYSEFAYSQQMQIILVFVTYIEKFLSTYMISNIILMVFHVSASRKQKVIFAIICGPLLQTSFVYAVYVIGGMLSFNVFTYQLVVNPNPITALVYYYTALKMFKLPQARSVKLMYYTYVFWIIRMVINRLIGAFFFVQDSSQYNYLLDATQQAVTLLLFVFICAFVSYFFRKKFSYINFTDNMFFDRRKELIIYFIQASFIFLVTVTIPMTLANKQIAYIMINLVLALLVVSNICIDMARYNRQTISNRDANISALFKGLEKQRGIKHDFNNILHTYSGYLELGEYERLKIYHSSLVTAASREGSISELEQKFSENPAIVSLLINKLEYAEQLSVRLLITIKCDLENFYIGNADISRILVNLLDNAIKLASDSEQRKVCCTIESKASGSKLIIITNSISLASSVLAHQKVGNTEIMLSDVRNIFSKYGNCSFQMQYRNQEASAYMELKEAK